MKKRTLLAAATLTALVLSVGALHPAPVEGAAEPAALAPVSAEGTLQAVETPAGPQWGWVWGYEGNESMAWAIVSAGVCSLFLGPGGFACGVTGAF